MMIDSRGPLQAREIADQIEYYVKTRLMGYGVWTIGITDEPDRRRSEHQRDGKDVSRWRHWQTITEEDARSVENWFVNNRGMKGGTGGDTYGRFVYIF